MGAECKSVAMSVISRSVKLVWIMISRKVTMRYPFTPLLWLGHESHATTGAAHAVEAPSLSLSLPARLLSLPARLAPPFQNSKSRLAPLRHHRFVLILKTLNFDFQVYVNGKITNYSHIWMRYLRRCVLILDVEQKVQTNLD